MARRGEGPASTARSAWVSAGSGPSPPSGWPPVKDADPENHERWLKIAVGDAREVSRFPGEFHSPALAMMGRLGIEQIRKKGELRDFAAGFNVARKNMDDIESLKERLDAASGDEHARLEKEWREHLQETAVRLRRVLDAADVRTDRRELNQARYFLAFVDYELGRNDEAAILADYAARRLHSINPELSRESARLALAAYEQEYEARPPAAAVRHGADRAGRWPSSSSATGPTRIVPTRPA